MLNVLLSKIFSIISLLAVLFLSLLVLNKNYHRLINRLFFFLTLILMFWLFGSFMMFGSKSESAILFWDRVVYMAVVFWPALQYHFSLAVTYSNNKRKRIMYGAYFLSIVFFILVQTPYFITDIFYYNWGMHTKAQIFHHIFLLYFFFYVGLFLYTLLKKYSSEKIKLEKNRIFFYIFGFFILNILGGSGFVPAYSISFPPISLVAPVLFSVIITYSIVYFNLMNVKLIMRRYFVYLLSFGVAIFPTYLILFLVGKHYPHYTFFVSILVFSFSLLFFSLAKKYIYRISNKYFFSSLYDFNQIVYNISLALHSSFDVNKIFKSISKLLLEAFHSKTMAVFSYDFSNNKVSLYYNKGLDGIKNNSIKINANNFKKYFTQNRPWKIEDLKVRFKGRDCKMLDFLEKLKIFLVVPIKAKASNVCYFMIFGKKESSESYNQLDLKVLELASFELSLALENIALYQEAQNFNLKLKSEIKRATIKLRQQNESLKQLDEMKDEFISVVSHQLRTPLTGIRWSTEILLKNKDNNLKEGQIELIKQMNVSNLSLIRLVNNLLDISRLQLGRKFIINIQPFNFSQLLAEVLQDNLFLIKNKNINIVDKIDKSLEVKADREKLKQVLLNLITNACKYSIEKGIIELSYEKKGEKQFFYVKDDGIGVPKDQQNYLFTRFFRANNASVKNTDGSGLGLYIAREIMRAHKGDLYFSPNKNKGSIFYFYLPN